MARSELVIGAHRGIVGLLMTPVNFILRVLIAVVAFFTVGQPLILAGVGTVMSGTEMAGAVISGGRLRTGGVIMMASGLVPLACPTTRRNGSYGFHKLLGVIGILYAFYFWTFILILSGLIAVLRGNKQQPSPCTSLTPVLLLFPKPKFFITRFPGSAHVSNNSNREEIRSARASLQVQRP